MLPMMMCPPTSLRRRLLLGRSHEAACKGGGERLTVFLRVGIVEANASPARSEAAGWLVSADPLSMIARTMAGRLRGRRPYQGGAAYHWSRLANNGEQYTGGESVRHNDLVIILILFIYLSQSEALVPVFIPGG
jgi:hypothetical protein